MAAAEEIPAPLISLGIEAAGAIASTYDTANFGGVALFDADKDSIIQALPSFEAAKEAICAPPLVTERYGTPADVGDRLTLQFVYQLFPRDNQRGIREHARRLWRRYLAELDNPVWVYRGVANLRNFTTHPGIPEPLRLAEGITIRTRSRAALLSLGLNEMTLDALIADARESVIAFSQHVICVEHSVAKTPANLIRGDSTGHRTLQRALTCLRLAAPGDITAGPMWTARSAKFDVGRGSGVGRSGWPTTDAGGPRFQLTRQIARVTRTLQPTMTNLEASSYGIGPGNLALALRSFEATYERFPRRSDSQLLDTITAAESLLSSGTAELTFKLSFRAAGLLGRTSHERLQIFDAMKNFYDARSKIVHGDNLKAKQRRALENVEDAREFVRRLLLAYVRLAGSPPSQYDRKFFDERLDAVLQDEQGRRRLVQDLGLSGA